VRLSDLKLAKFSFLFLSFLKFGSFLSNFAFKFNDDLKFIFFYLILLTCFKFQI